MPRTLLNHGGVTAAQLFSFLLRLSAAEREQMQLFIQMAPKGAAFNIRTVDEVVEDEYAFLGTDVPCLIFHTSEFAPPE
jgi:hypothetical protein